MKERCNTIKNHGNEQCINVQTMPYLLMLSLHCFARKLLKKFVHATCNISSFILWNCHGEEDMPIVFELLMIMS